MDKNTRISKSETAYIEIRRIITEFVLMPGQVICIKDLSNFLDFSTTPLREAPFGLEKDGYVARNRKDSFHVTNIDGDYIRSLFEYGKILYMNATGDCCGHKNHDQGDQANLLRDGPAAAFDIDRLYQNAQDSTKNHFVCWQMNIYRIKAKSIRTALFHYDNELCSIIYGNTKTLDPIECGPSKSFEETHLKKNEFAQDISRSVMSYAISKRDSCGRVYDGYPPKDFVK